jgi:GntR family transcriptional repressor for pyruvate dehydrogenase complex
VSNSGTNNASHESLADVSLEGAFDPEDRRLILEAIHAIEVVEARQVIELAIVRLAALRRSEAEFERLCALLDGMQQCRDDAEAFAECDFALHLTLSHAARNALLAERLAVLHGSMREAISRSATSAIAENRVGALIESHAQLVEAIGRRDVHGAAHVFSTMMNDLRIESGRCRPGTDEYVIRRRVPQTGMLDDMPHTKGDRP